MCQLNFIQLHGNETPEYCDSLISRVSLPIIKALKTDGQFCVGTLVQYSRTSYFLFDLDENDSRRPKNGALDRLWSEAAAVRRKGFDGRY